MTAQLDLERVVTEWLRADASASGSDRVLTATLDRVSTVRQERRRLPWPTWRRPQMSPTLSMAMVAAAVLVVAVAGVNLLSPNRDRGGNVPLGPTPVPESTPTACPQPSMPQEPGQQVITVFAPIRLTIDLPESSLASCWETTTAGRVDPVWWASFGGDRALIGAHPGGIGITTADPVPADCAGFPTWDRAEVTIDGFVGERFDYARNFTPPFVCHPNTVVDQLGETSGRGPDTLFTLWMLDVNGERLSLFAWIKSVDHVRQEELQRMVESVQIETIGAPPVAVSPSPAAPRPTMAGYISRVRSMCMTQDAALQDFRVSMGSGDFPLQTTSLKDAVAVSQAAVAVTEQAIERLRSYAAPELVRPHLDRVYKALEAPLIPLRAMPAAVAVAAPGDRQRIEDLATQHFLRADETQATLLSIASKIETEGASRDWQALVRALAECPPRLG